jgi:hypothetical protein
MPGLKCEVKVILEFQCACSYQGIKPGTLAIVEYDLPSMLFIQRALTKKFQIALI